MMRKNYTKGLLTAALLTLALFLTGCFSNTTVIEDESKVKVVVSFYPHQFLAEKIGGEFVSVTPVVSSGVEPHDYEPTPEQISKILHAQVFMYHGANFDPWAERVIKEAPSTLITVRASEGLQLLTGFGEESEHGDSGVSGVDPHFWLDPSLMEKVAARLTAALSKQDPSHAAQYQKNYELLAQELNEVHALFVSKMQDCKQDFVVTSHNAFSYMANRYSFTVESMSGLSPKSEPSLNNLKKLRDLLNQHGIKYVLTETLASSRFAQTLADEVGAQTLVLNPIEGLTQEQAASGENYLSLMRQNAETLGKARECK